MFDQRYEVFLADTPESKRLNYRLRYEIYCEEKGFLSMEGSSASLEYDRFDHNAVHFIVRCRVTGRWVAASRLVVATPRTLPMSEHCEYDSHLSFLNSQPVAEISRICVTSEYRASGPTLSKPDRSTALERKTRARRESEIMIGLLCAAGSYAKQTNIPSLFFICSAPLARIINRLRIDIHRIGPEVDYHGKRAPYMGHVDRGMMEFFNRDNPAADGFSQNTFFRRASELEPVEDELFEKLA